LGDRGACISPITAAAAGMSPAHVSRELRDAFGETPHQYLLTVRAYPPVADRARIPTCVVRAWARPQSSSFGEDSSKMGGYGAVRERRPTMLNQHTHVAVWVNDQDEALALARYNGRGDTNDVRSFRCARR
jgi:hypothetical protein